MATNVDGHVAHDLDALVVRVLLDGLPLTVKEELGGDELLDRILVLLRKGLEGVSLPVGAWTRCSGGGRFRELGRIRRARSSLALAFLPIPLPLLQQLAELSSTTTYARFLSSAAAVSRLSIAHFSASPSCSYRTRT